MITMGGKKRKKKFQDSWFLMKEVFWFTLKVHGAEVCLLLVGFHQKKCKITRVNLMHMFDKELTPSRPCDEPGMPQLGPYGTRRESTHIPFLSLVVLF